MSQHALTKKIIALVFFCVGIQCVHAQSVSLLIGAKNAGMGYVSSVLSNEWSLFNNVGSMGNYRDASLAVSHEITPSLLGSHRTAVALSIPIGKGTFGFGFFRFGDVIYNEQILSAGYSNRLGIASLGVQLSYIQYNTKERGFNKKNLLGITLGGLVEITPKLFIGAYAFNINQALTASTNNTRLPTVLVIGIKFNPHEKFSIAAEVEKDLEYEPIIKGGASYTIQKKIALRIGFNLNPNALFGGVGYQIKKLGIDYALQYNLEQEIRHQASVHYRIKNSTVL